MITKDLILIAISQAKHMWLRLIMAVMPNTHTGIKNTQHLQQGRDVHAKTIVMLLAVNPFVDPSPSQSSWKNMLF